MIDLDMDVLTKEQRRRNMQAIRAKEQEKIETSNHNTCLRETLRQTGADGALTIVPPRQETGWALFLQVLRAHPWVQLPILSTSCGRGDE